MKRTPNSNPPALAERAERIVTPISRRGVLRGLSLAAIGLSLPVWRRMEAEAQSTPAPQRFISFFTANGTIAAQFFPSSATNPTGSNILKPLAPYAAKVNVLKGVHLESTIGTDKPGGPHMKGPAAMLTGGWLLSGSFTGSGGPAGYANRISLDQELANTLGQATRFKSLEFGVDIRGQEPLRYISYRGPNQPNRAVDDPWQMYARIFGNFVSPSDPQAAARRREDESVLDYTREELQKLNSRLPSEDRPRLESHLEHIRAIERELDAAAPLCKVPGALGTQIDPHVAENYPTIGKLQMDLMFQAHACDLTRISTFMWSNADSWQRTPWLGINDEHHALSHEDTDPVVLAKLVKINTWYFSQIAYFLGLLATIPEGTKTMLDNSLVLCGNELGRGRTHSHEDIPWVLAGSAGGKLVTGKFIDYGGKPHNNLLLTVLHAFGKTSATSFGAPENCTGTLAGLLA